MNVLFYHDKDTGDFGVEVNGEKHVADNRFHSSLYEGYTALEYQNKQLLRQIDRMDKEIVQLKSIEGGEQAIDLDKRLERAKSRAEIAECKLNMIKGVFEESGGW